MVFSFKFFELLHQVFCLFVIIILKLLNFKNMKNYKFSKISSKNSKSNLDKPSSNFFDYLVGFGIDYQNCAHDETLQDFEVFRSSEIDEIYETVIKNRTYYTYYFDTSETQFISYGSNFRRGSQYGNSESVKTNYRLFSTNREIANMFSIFGSFLNNNEELTKKCKKLIDLKQFIIVLIMFGDDVENFSYKKIKKIFEKICTDTFHFCGFLVKNGINL